MDLPLNYFKFVCFFFLFFFVFFLKQLGYFVLRSANEGFENGELSIT